MTADIVILAIALAMVFGGFFIMAILAFQIANHKKGRK